MFPASAFDRSIARALNDERDVIFVRLMLGIALIQVPYALALFWLGDFSWWFAVGYWALWGTLFLDKFILMLHCTSHRPLFNKRYRLLNLCIPWLLGPFCGETPEAYFVHHMGMHHKEGNMHGDLSSTLRFQRDKFTHWLRYFGRFMTIGLFELYAYHIRNGKPKLARRLVVGEGSFWLMVVVLASFTSFQATMVVFVIPVVVVRMLMMMGNWGQHAFVDPADPANDFKSSITCINSRYNRRCFNDGYHIIHHLKPALHYSEMDSELQQHLDRYAAQDAIVFDGLDFFLVWLLLMTKQYGRLARAFVRLPGAPQRTDAEVVAFLRSRLVPIPRPT